MEAYDWEVEEVVEQEMEKLDYFCNVVAEHNVGWNRLFYGAAGE